MNSLPSDNKTTVKETKSSEVETSVLPRMMLAADREGRHGRKESIGSLAVGTLLALGRSDIPTQPAAG